MIQHSKAAGKRKALPSTSEPHKAPKPLDTGPPCSDLRKPGAVHEERGPDGVLLAQIFNGKTRRIYAGRVGSERIVRVEKPTKDGATRTYIYEGGPGQEHIIEVRNPDGSRDHYSGAHGSELLKARTLTDGTYCTYVQVRDDLNNKMVPTLATKKDPNGAVSYYAAHFASDGHNPLLEQVRDCNNVDEHVFYSSGNQAHEICSERVGENHTLEWRFYNHQEGRLIHTTKSPVGSSSFDGDEHEYFLSKNEKIATTITMANGASVSGTTLEGVEGQQRCCCVCLGNKMDTLTALLPCCHTTCAECASKVATSGDKRCPTCRGALRGLLNVIL